MEMIGSPSCRFKVWVDGRIWPVTEVAYEDFFESLAEFSLMRLGERLREALGEDPSCFLSISSQCFFGFTELTFLVPLLPRLPLSHREGLREDAIIFVCGKLTDFVDNLVGADADRLYPLINRAVW